MNSIKKILKHGRLEQHKKMKKEILDLRKQNEVQTVLFTDNTGIRNSK